MAVIDLEQLMSGREFVHVATATATGMPNAAPKFLLKVDGRVVYLVDYTIGKTWQNLRENPQASISFMDQATLTGYQLNGTIRIVDKGRVYERMCREMVDKEIRLTAQHIIEDIRGKGTREHFEVAITDRFVIFKLTVTEVVRIGYRGDVVRNDMSG